MDENSNIRMLFGARAPAIPPHDLAASGTVTSYHPLTYPHYGRNLDFSILRIDLAGQHGPVTKAAVILPHHHPDLVDSKVSGNLYTGKGAYTPLIGHDDPYPGYIHALMTFNPDAYFDPYSMEIEGFGRVPPPASNHQIMMSWFSGLIGKQKGVKPSHTTHLSP